MTFSTDLDALLAKVQHRIDAAMGEAREDLKELAIEAEKDWSDLQRRFSDACRETVDETEKEPTSHSETPTDGVGEQPPG